MSSYRNTHEGAAVVTSQPEIEEHCCDKSTDGPLVHSPTGQLPASHRRQTVHLSAGAWNSQSDLGVLEHPVETWCLEPEWLGESTPALSVHGPQSQLEEDMMMMILPQLPPHLVLCLPLQGGEEHGVGALLLASV